MSEWPKSFFSGFKAIKVAVVALRSARRRRGNNVEVEEIKQVR